MTNKETFYVVGFDDGESLHPVAAYLATGDAPELASPEDWFITQRAENSVSALNKVQRSIDNGALGRLLSGL